MLEDVRRDIPWPTDPERSPLNPSERTTGPAYSPPRVEWMYPLPIRLLAWLGIGAGCLALWIGVIALIDHLRL